MYDVEQRKQLKIVTITVHASTTPPFGSSERMVKRHWQKSLWVIWIHLHHRKIVTRIIEREDPKQSNYQKNTVHHTFLSIAITTAQLLLTIKSTEIVSTYTSRKSLSG
jgi:hypothetical protein